MRSTGILSLRGNGRFLDFNSFEQKKIDYVLSKYSSIKIYLNLFWYFSNTKGFSLNNLIGNINKSSKSIELLFFSFFTYMFFIIT